MPKRKDENKPEVSSPDYTGEALRIRGFAEPYPLTRETLGEITKSYDALLDPSQTIVIEGTLDSVLKKQSREEMRKIAGSLGITLSDDCQPKSLKVEFGKDKATVVTLVCESDTVVEVTTEPGG